MSPQTSAANPLAPATPVRVLVLNGPNLNLLGERDPATYGTHTLAELETRISDFGTGIGAEVTCTQSNHEGGLIDAIHAARNGDGIVINPGAYAHSSYALRDAIAAVQVPCVEVHISNVHAREPFRHTSLTAPVCLGVVCGFGVLGYELGVRAVVESVRGK